MLEGVKNFLQPSLTSLEAPQSLLEPSSTLWTVLQRTLRRLGARARRLAGLKTCPGRFPAALWCPRAHLRWCYGRVECL